MAPRPGTEDRAPGPSAGDLPAALAAAQAAARRGRGRSVDAVLAGLDRVILAWLEPDSTWRRRAEHLLPAATGFSPQMIRHGLPLLLAPLRGAAVGALLDAELGTRHVLDGPHHERQALGPALITHVLSGNIPGLAAFPIVLSLAVKSAALIKSAAGDPVFPALFAASVRSIDTALADCIVVADWRGGDPRFEEVAFRTADLVVASGADTAITAIRSRVSGRFIGHGHKVSVAVVGKECLDGDAGARRLAQRLAYDVSLWDQQGCLSPQLCYIETGAAVTPEDFARLLGEALDDYAHQLPPRTLTLEEQAAVLRFRQTSEWHDGYALLASPGSTAWTISLERDACFTSSCLNRCLRLKVVEDLAVLATALAAHRHQLEAAGVAVGGDRIAGVTSMLGACGVHRICPLGTMQTPTLAWRQGGRPRIAEWVEWVGIEAATAHGSGAA